MEIRNPKYPWKPSHPWDNCPGCFEQFDLKTCNHCGSGYPDEYVEVESPPTALGLAREEIAELKRQLEEASKGALVCANRILQQEQKIGSIYQQLTESQAREARLRGLIESSLEGWSLPASLRYHIESAYFALQHDDTALKEYIDVVIDDCAKVCENSDRYRGDYFAIKVRELKNKE